MERLTLEEITVTGSRIRRTTDFNTPNPTTVVDADYLQNLGIVNIGDAIEQLPANLSTFQPTTTGNSSFFAGSTIANLRGLNPFFGSRTLTLVNNQRFVPTNQGDGVDLNFIPSILIERMDVVTGGASAAYGSGAISGVTNIFLNRKLQGGKVEVDYGTTEAGGGADRHFGAAFGSSLFGERGHFVLGAEYQKSDRVNCIQTRDWCAKSIGFFSNPGTTVDANGNVIEPEHILVQGLRQNQNSPTGVFYGTGLQVNADGTGVVPFDMGNRVGATDFFDQNTEGGDGVSVYRFTDLKAPVERRLLTGSFDFEVNDNINMTVDLTYGKVETRTIQGSSAVNHSFFDSSHIKPDNAYLTPELSDALAQANAFGIPAGWFKKDWSNQVDVYTDTTTDVKRAVLGFNGSIGNTSWTWDAYYQYGDTDREIYLNDNRHLVAYMMATDSVLDANGNPVCRVTRDGFDAVAATNPTYRDADPRLAIGCVPLNPFGTGPIDPAAKAYAFGYLRENLDYEQQVVAANMSGDLFEGFGAGPIQAAFGLEFRTEVGHNVGMEEQPDYVRTDYNTQFGDTFAGRVNVTEAFLETNLPLLRDRPGANLLEVNAAVRQSQYRNKGLEGTGGVKRTHDITAWKLSGMWDPVEWLRFRGSRSRDIRAANFRELYYRQRISAGGLFGYSDFPTNQDPASWSLEGNVNLDPEKADTTTVGFVFTPKGNVLDGFQFAADYYRIVIEDAITPADVFRVVAGCREDGIQEFCDLLTFGDPAEEDPTDPLSNITAIRAQAFNFREYVTKGIDFTSSWSKQFDTSRLSVRLIATRMIEQIVQATAVAPPGDIAGMTGTNNGFLADFQSSPDWVANLAATWTRGPLSLTGQVRYVSDGKMDYDGLGPEDNNFAGADPTDTTLDTYSTNRVPSYQVFNLSGSYTFENRLGASSVQVYGVIDNVFDKEPPVATGPAFGVGFGGTNPIFFDTLGRSYKLGMRMSF